MFIHLAFQITCMKWMEFVFNIDRHVNYCIELFKIKQETHTIVLLVNFVKYTYDKYKIMWGKKKSAGPHNLNEKYQSTCMLPLAELCSFF